MLADAFGCGWKAWGGGEAGAPRSAKSQFRLQPTNLQDLCETLVKTHPMQSCPTEVSLKFLWKSLSLRLKCVGEKPSIKVMALFSHFLPTHTPNLTWHYSKHETRPSGTKIKFSWGTLLCFLGLVFFFFGEGGEYILGHFLVLLRGHFFGFFAP